MAIVPAFSKISEINTEKSSWNVKAKIIRLWQLSDFNRSSLLFSIEMVLLDSFGGRIHATIKKTLLYKFKNNLSEGNTYSFENMGVATNGGGYRTTNHSYKLNFQYRSIFQPLSNFNIALSPYNFVPISKIIGGGYDSDYLADVIGVLTGIGAERELEKNGKITKLNVIALEADGHTIQCTLFGSYVDILNNFIASGDSQNAVVIVQFAKAKTFQDKIHIQNCMNCTKLVFNPTCEAGAMMRVRISENIDTLSPITLTQLKSNPTVSITDEFLLNTPRRTIQGLKESSNDSLYVVYGTIKRILNAENYWYTACTCTKAVIPDSGMFFCEKCDKHVMKVFPRYCIKVRVIDESDCATLVIFDKDASALLNKSCATMIEEQEKSAGVKILPAEIVGLVERSFLFKVETKVILNTKFEQSFLVRKICNDPSIIQEFKTRWEREDAALNKKTNENTSLSTLFMKEKDCLITGSSNVLSQEIVSLTEPAVGKLKDKVVIKDCAIISEDLMPKFVSAASETYLVENSKIDIGPSSKRESPTNQNEEDVNQPLKLIKRSIKIEKL